MGDLFFTCNVQWFSDEIVMLHPLELSHLYIYIALPCIQTRIWLQLLKLAKSHLFVCGTARRWIQCPFYKVVTIEESPHWPSVGMEM